jgi:hypothetical protein
VHERYIFRMRIVVADRNVIGELANPLLHHYVATRNLCKQLTDATSAGPGGGTRPARILELDVGARCLTE